MTELFCKASSVECLTFIIFVGSFFCTFFNDPSAILVCYVTFRVADDGIVAAMFPMSSLLRDRKFKLGRGCRMLSLQAMEKSAVHGVGGVSSIVLLFCSGLFERNVKRIRLVQMKQ